MQRWFIRSERRKRRTVPIAVGLAAALTWGLAGCLFEPREPMNPCNPLTDITCRAPAPFEPALAPENVRNNIEAALERPTVEPNYRDSLSELFRYIPDQFNGSDHACFVNWNREIEVEFMSTVLEAQLGVRPTTVTMTFPLFMDSGELTEPRKRYNVRYEVALTFPDSTRTPPTRTDRYGAEALWDFIRPDLNSSWTLERWEDITPTPGTLGSLGLLRFGRGPCR
jgi:hypothetical protein